MSRNVNVSNLTQILHIRGAFVPEVTSKAFLLALVNGSKKTLNAQRIVLLQNALGFKHSNPTKIFDAMKTHPVLRTYIPDTAVTNAGKYACTVLNTFVGN